MRPLQNRVAPDGAIEAVAARGLLMGNRGGALHDAAQRLSSRRWVSSAWIACVLVFKDWRRPVMQPGRYTELFFLDEATALAAGHRPCALCRRADFERFKAAWPGPERRAPAIDAALHAARLVAGTREQRRDKARLTELPPGTMVRVDGGAARAYLVSDDVLWPWHFAGYGTPEPRPAALSVEVLTPTPLIGVLRRGYQPSVHPTAAR